MIDVDFYINKNDVFAEVAKTTAYLGSKMLDTDENAYERIFTTDADQQMLARFWHECQVDVCEALKKFLADEQDNTDAYHLSLQLSQSFDTALQESIDKELFSFFVTAIVAKWCTFTNKNEAAEYATAAASLLQGIRRKVFHKKKPTRPTY